MTNLHDILEKMRAANQRLPPNEAAVLFAAAVRLAAAHGATLRSRLVQIDDSGGLRLASFDEQAQEPEPGYLAPELLLADAPRKTEPRVQVYAAGALGFELLTGHRPPGNLAELHGPLGDIVRIALAQDRRERFGDLAQLHDAVEGVQPRPPPEGERNILSALRTRWTRAPLEKEAVARIIEKLGALDAQVAHLAKAQARLDAAQRQTLERIERFEDGQQRVQASRRAPSVAGPALLAAVLAAAAVVGAGWWLGLLSPQPRPVPQPVAQAPSPPPAAEEPPPARRAAPAKPPPEKAAAEEKLPPAESAAEPAPTDAGAVAAATPDAGAETAADAGAPALAAAHPDAGPPAAAPAPRRHPRPEVSQAALLHAVAVSQVRRGESALERGRAADALESFRAALENEATLAVAFRGMGMAYAMQGNDAQALQAYTRYLQLAPSAPDRADIRRSITELKSRSKIGGGEK